MGINILSLFDGMGGLMIALNTLGVEVDNYYASEIDKFAIAQTKLNFPNVIHLGSITNIKASNLKEIDLIAFGSPCQGFSYAGRGLNFEDPRSALFFEAVRLLKECQIVNPNVLFLMENVNMPEKWRNVISDHLGILPVNINSNLVSAQNRNRWYWTNIRTKTKGVFSENHTDIPQPKNKGIYLSDILETNVDEKYYYSSKALEWMTRHGNRTGKLIKLFKGSEKFPCLEATMYKKYSAQRFWAIFNDKKMRYITPTECARLQTIPEWYKWGCSDTQQYKMLGNGWTNDVIVHILSFIKFKPNA